MMNDPNRHEPETMASQHEEFEARLRQVAPTPTSASLERVLERLDLRSELAPPENGGTGLRLPAWAVFGSGAGLGALAASIAWIAMIGWSGPTNQGSPIASQPTVAPSIGANPEELASSSGPKVEPPAAGSGALRPTYSVASDEFGVDMIRNTLSAVSKQQWDRRRLEERGYSISARSNRSADPNASPSRRVSSQSNNSLWDLRRGNLDGIDL